MKREGKEISISRFNFLLSESLRTRLITIVIVVINVTVIITIQIAAAIHMIIIAQLL